MTRPRLEGGNCPYRQIWRKRATYGGRRGANPSSQRGKDAEKEKSLSRTVNGPGGNYIRAVGGEGMDAGKGGVGGRDGKHYYIATKRARNEKQAKG